MEDRRTRFVDDIARHPIDKLAAVNTTKGAMWCTPNTDYGDVDWSNIDAVDREWVEQKLVRLWFLQSELHRQSKELKALESQGGKKSRRRRKTLRNQIKKLEKKLPKNEAQVEARLAELGCFQ
jgi:hypothetical protein